MVAYPVDVCYIHYVNSFTNNGCLLRRCLMMVMSLRSTIISEPGQSLRHNHQADWSLSINPMSGKSCFGDPKYRFEIVE
jgi:hypothetical protein